MLLIYQHWIYRKELIHMVKKMIRKENVKQIAVAILVIFSVFSLPLCLCAEQWDSFGLVEIKKASAHIQKSTDDVKAMYIASKVAEELDKLGIQPNTSRLGRLQSTWKYGDQSKGTCADLAMTLEQALKGAGFKSWQFRKIQAWSSYWDAGSVNINHGALAVAIDGKTYIYDPWLYAHLSGQVNFAGFTGSKFNGIPAEEWGKIMKELGYNEFNSPDMNDNWGPMNELIKNIENSLASITVEISSQTAVLNQGETALFTAEVKNANNDKVAWSIKEANGGTITQTGPNSAAYQAPNKGGEFYVVATSLQDKNKKGAKKITVNQIELSLNPYEEVLLKPGSTQSYQATVKGAKNPAVTWSATGGNINNGLFTAPHNAGVYTITARSVQDPAQYAKATVRVKEEEKKATGEFEKCIQGQKKIYDDYVAWSQKVGTKDYWSLFRCGPVGTNWQEYPPKECCDTHVPKEDWDGLQRCGWKYKLEKEKATLDNKIEECKKKYPGVK